MQDALLRLVVAGRLEDLVRPAVLHERVRQRAYRRLAKDLRGLGHGWWRRRRAVRHLRKEVRRLRREPSPSSEALETALGRGGEVFFEALMLAL